MRNKWTGMGLALLLAAGAAVAATPKPPSEAQVRQLMEVFGVDRMLGQMNTQMAAMMEQEIPCVPASYWQGFIDPKGAQELTERARLRGVGVAAAASFSPARKPSVEAVRISLGATANARQVESAMRTLASLMGDSRLGSSVVV